MKLRRFGTYGYFSLVVGFIIARVAIGTVNADTTLAVPERYQEHSQWCWVGTSKAILDYYKKTVSQGTIANWAWVRSDCANNTDFYWSHPCNQPNDLYGTPGSVQGILSNWGVNSNARTYALTQPTCVAEINNGRPFVMRFGWTSGGGHIMAGYGYDQNGLYLDYMDPWPGNGYTKSLYTWVVSASDHKWTHSLQVTTAPPPPSEIELNNGFPVNHTLMASVCQGTWRYYYFDLPNGVQSLVINLYNLSADLDLYVNWGSKPSHTIYSCRPYVNGTVGETCRCDPPGCTPPAGRYWIGVNNWDTGTISYSVKATWIGKRKAMPWLPLLLGD